MNGGATRLDIGLFLLCLITPATTLADCCAVPAITRLKVAIELAYQSINRTLHAQGRAITEQLVANNESRNHAIREQTQVLETLLKAHAITLNAMEAERLYGAAREVQVNGKKRRLSAQSPSLCRELAAARSLSTLPQHQARAEVALAESQRAHNEDFHSDNAAMDQLREAERPHFDLFWMNKDLLSRKEARHAVESIKNLVNPRPLPRLEAGHKDTPQGRTYLAQRAVINQKYQLAQQALNEQLLLRSPLIQEQQGYNSLLGKLQERIRDTIGDHSDDPWTEQLERKATAGLLRELNIGLMHLYRLGMEQMRNTQDVSTLLAALLANDNERQRQVVQDEYLRVLSIDDARDDT